MRGDYRRTDDVLSGPPNGIRARGGVHRQLAGPVVRAGFFDRGDLFENPESLA